MAYRRVLTLNEYPHDDLAGTGRGRGVEPEATPMPDPALTAPALIRADAFSSNAEFAQSG
jgi:hypothetical protein